VKVHRRLWLKQLRVVVSTEAIIPSRSSPQNSQKNVVDLHLSICNFKTHENFSKVYIIMMTEEQ
jgi:hypothetical protein